MKGPYGEPTDQVWDAQLTTQAPTLAINARFPIVRQGEIARKARSTIKFDLKLYGANRPDEMHLSRLDNDVLTGVNGMDLSRFPRNVVFNATSDHAKLAPNSGLEVVL